MDCFSIKLNERKSDKHKQKNDEHWFLKKFTKVKRTNQFSY